MKIVTLTQSAADLDAVMDDVCTDHAAAVLSRENGKDVVIMSLADFNSIQETLHLLGSPRNAARLMESIAELREGKAQPRELIVNEEQESGQQTSSKDERSLMDR